MLLLNLESIRENRQHWERTVRANIALHYNIEDVFEVTTRQIGKFSAASLGSRILIEMAICTCSLDEEEVPDELEISTLLGSVLLLFHLGAWSDAIRSNLFPPQVHISAFGQVMLNYDFEKTVMTPYQTMFGWEQRTAEAKRYEKLYENYNDARPFDEIFPASYLEAWNEEYHVSASDMRRMFDALENLGISQKEAVFAMNRSGLIAYLLGTVHGLKDIEVEKCLKKISLTSRSKWDQSKKMLPVHIEPQDWYPWNFRRKLSLVSRPLVELDSSEDPLLLVSPSALRESFGYLLSNSFDAVFEERHFESRLMKKWIGGRRNQLGNEFNQMVARKMVDLGWEAESDVLVTKLLNRKTDKDYGDIDVLAWYKELGLVVAAECKDLFFAKTHKEIGNQINEFLGVINEKGERDRLRKHFDRLDVLMANISAITRYIGLGKIDKIYGLIVFSQRNIIEYAPQIPKTRIHVCALETLTTPKELAQKLIPWSLK